MRSAPKIAEEYCHEGMSFGFNAVQMKLTPYKIKLTVTLNIESKQDQRLILKVMNM
jgi:hypothetical protein